MSTMKIPIAAMMLAISCWSVTGFSPVNSNANRDASISTISTSSSTSRLYAGFGGGGMGKKGDVDKKKKKKNTANKETKLKPKSQWDRYAEFKREPKVQVGVRIKEDESDEWLVVGHVKSKDSKYTAAAVFRQRAIIADHAKRLFPLQLSSKKTLEWGYNSAAGDDEDGEVEWKIVDKSSVSEEVEGLEKLIGFQGTADPASGFYIIDDSGKFNMGVESSYTVSSVY